ncbi:uncharacterized protein ACIBXB_021289 [Morphnus guianensis]
MAPCEDLPYERTSVTSCLKLNFCQYYFFQPLYRSISTGIADIGRSMFLPCFPVTSMPCPGGQGMVETQVLQDPPPCIHTERPKDSPGSPGIFNSSCSRSQNCRGLPGDSLAWLHKSKTSQCLEESKGARHGSGLNLCLCSAVKYQDAVEGAGCSTWWSWTPDLLDELTTQRWQQKQLQQSLQGQYNHQSAVLERPSCPPGRLFKRKKTQPP